MYSSLLGEPRDRGRSKGFEIATNLDNAGRVEAVYWSLKNLEGIGLLAEPKNVFIGGRAFSFLDPEGHAWEVIWKSGTSFDGRGARIFLEIVCQVFWQENLTNSDSIL